jgi:hypothetical protein
MQRTGDLEQVLARVLSGDAEAWSGLMEQAWPLVARQVAASRSLGPLRRSADDRNEVASLVFSRLRRDGFRALRLFGGWRARHPDKEFGDWLAIVTANVIRDHVSRRLAAGTAVDRLLDTLTDSLAEHGTGAVRPPFTRSAAARQLLERARRTLPPEQLGPLESWLRGHDFEEIASMHRLAGEKDAQRKIRAALGRLRHHVRDE